MNLTPMNRPGRGGDRAHPPPQTALSATVTSRARRAFWGGGSPRPSRSADPTTTSPYSTVGPFTHDAAKRHSFPPPPPGWACEGGGKAEEL